MFSWIKKKITGHSLDQSIKQTQVVRINGIRFTIKKIDVSNHVEGYNVLLKIYSTYEEKRMADQKINDANLEKLKEFYKQIFCAAVVSPKLSFKEKQGFAHVDDLFVDWDLCHQLYEAIMAFTGKKKVKFS